MARPKNAGNGRLEEALTSLIQNQAALMQHQTTLMQTQAAFQARAAEIDTRIAEMERINSERLVFISDTCYSGASGGRTIPYPGMRANISGAFLERISQGKGRVILTASDANELSMERDDMKHGVFTYYLLEGLRGKADLDQDGVITVDEVYRYVSTRVPQATSQGQHPARKGEVTGQIILGVVK